MTFHSIAEDRLIALWRGVMGGECPDHVRAILASLLFPWGDTPLPKHPAWLSDVGDDHTPFEFSFVLGGGRPELRILAEAQGEAPTPEAFWEASRALSQRLERDFGVELGRLREIEDLFRPRGKGLIFAAWHAVCLYRDKEPEWKLYLNPKAGGEERTTALVQEAMTRLGYPHALPTLCEVAGQRGPALDEIMYFSLDLSKSSAARMKVYYRHHRATAADLERAFAVAKSHQPGDAIAFCRAMTESEGPFLAKSIGSCFSFKEDDRERPAAVTLYVPVAHYAPDDAIIKARIERYLRAQGIALSDYNGPLTSFAKRPLDEGIGMHSYASFKREKQKPRMTIYLAPEAFHVEPTSVLSSLLLKDEVPRAAEANG